MSGKKATLVDMTLPLQGDLTPYVIKARDAGCDAVLTNQVEPGVFKRNTFVAVLAMVYSVYALYASGKDAVMGGMLVLAIGYLVWGLIAPRFAPAVAKS